MSGREKGGRRWSYWYCCSSVARWPSARGGVECGEASGIKEALLPRVWRHTNTWNIWRMCQTQSNMPRRHLSGSHMRCDVEPRPLWHTQAPWPAQATAPCSNRGGPSCHRVSTDGHWRPLCRQALFKPKDKRR